MMVGHSRYHMDGWMDMALTYGAAWQACYGWGKDGLCKYRTAVKHSSKSFFLIVSLIMR
jgi:hypothetical protein